jgi:prepilin-type processing-associated H-X9-DG protein
MAIIGLLAVLLLPVLERGKARARLVSCQNNLEQLGIAFHSFAHDHNGKFPMQTPVAEGGAQEFVQNGYLVKGGFYFAFRNFQPLADGLDTPRILICPADTRLPATNFNSLKNKNLSYFVGVDADYNQPESVLAGDRNLVAGPVQSIYSAAGQTLRWSGIMHQFKGNLLFADGHVEESKEFFLAGGTGGLAARNDFFIPSVKAEPGFPQTASAGPGFSSPASLAGVTNNHGTVPAVLANGSNVPPTSPKPPGAKDLNHAGKNSPTSRSIQSADAPPANPVALVQPATNAATAAPEAGYSVIPFFDHELVKFFRSLIGWGYLLLLLLLLLLLAFEARRRWRQAQKS